MKNGDPNFMTSIDLMNARDAIQKVIDGFDEGFDRIEYMRVAMESLGSAIEKMYKTKLHQIGALKVRVEDLKEEMREQEMGDD